MEKKTSIRKKLLFVFACVFGLALFLMYRVGIEVGEKWAIILLLVVSVAIFVMGRYTKSTFLSVMAVGNIIYAVLVLTFNEARWETVLDGKLTRILPVTILVMISLVMARVSSAFVLLFGVLLVLGIPVMVTSIIKKGSLPDVQSVVKGGRRVHLYPDYQKRQTELIYRQGNKKKILDIYPWEEDSRFHASIEWTEKEYVIVRIYNTIANRVLEEKRYEL